MIRALTGFSRGPTFASAGFLAAAATQPLPGVELSSAWYAFGCGQPRGASGWHFFTAGAAEERFALALRGGVGWACGGHDPDELGEFLRCVGANRLTLSAQAAAPTGFLPAQRMLGYQMLCPGGDAAKTPLPPVPAGYRLMRERDSARMTGFLRREGAFASPDAPAGTAPEPDELAAQAAAARLFAAELNTRIAAGLGAPAVLLDPEGQVAAALLFTTTVYARAVCLSALQVRAGLQGQGLGRWLALRAAAEARRLGQGLCLLCRPERAGFYEQSGFAAAGEYLCYLPAPQFGA